jgi:PAT family beta-lactamase induction signal transducer AmpG
MNEILLETPVRDLARPSHMFWLSAPYGLYTTAIVGGCLSFLMRRIGIPLDQIAQYTAFLVIPSSIYFLWSPLVDLGIARRFWFLLSNFFTIALMVAGTLMLQKHLKVAVLFYFLGVGVGMLMSAACGGIMAEVFTPGSKLRAASWYQMGNLAVGSIGTGVLIWLAARVGMPLWATIAALLMLLPSLSALVIHEPKREKFTGWSSHLQGLWREFKQTFLNRHNVIALLMLGGPAGSGAIFSLLPAIAQDYHVRAVDLAWMNGPAGGVMLAIGAFVGGRLPSRVNIGFAYGALGLLMGFASMLLWLGPATPAVYLTSLLTYTFLMGSGYAFYSGLVLDVVGPAGCSGSTRYTLLNSLGNLPIAYMAWMEGMGARHFGFRGFSMFESLGAMLVIPLLILTLRQKGLVSRPDVVLPGQ